MSFIYFTSCTILSATVASCLGLHEKTSPSCQLQQWSDTADKKLDVDPVQASLCNVGVAKRSLEEINKTWQESPQSLQIFMVPRV